MRVVLMFVVLLASACAPAQNVGEKQKPLAAFLGHWEGSANFLTTKMSEAGKISSVLDCAWSPQRESLVCDQTITDSKGKHHKLTIYVPNESDTSYTYCTFTAVGKTPYMGSLTTKNSSWIYNGPPDSAGTFPQFRTTNTFKNSGETFRVEFTENGANWTLMLEGTMHRTR